MYLYYKSVDHVRNLNVWDLNTPLHFIYELKYLWAKKNIQFFEGTIIKEEYYYTVYYYTTRNNKNSIPKQTVVDGRSLYLKCLMWLTCW